MKKILITSLLTLLFISCNNDKNLIKSIESDNSEIVYYQGKKYIINYELNEKGKTVFSSNNNQTILNILKSKELSCYVDKNGNSHIFKNSDLMKESIVNEKIDSKKRGNLQYEKNVTLTFYRHPYYEGETLEHKVKNKLIVKNIDEYKYFRHYGWDNEISSLTINSGDSRSLVVLYEKRYLNGKSISYYNEYKFQSIPNLENVFMSRKFFFFKKYWDDEISSYEVFVY